VCHITFIELFDHFFSFLLFAFFLIVKKQHNAKEIQEEGRCSRQNKGQEGKRWQEEGEKEKEEREKEQVGSRRCGSSTSTPFDGQALHPHSNPSTKMCVGCWSPSIKAWAIGKQRTE